MVQGRYALWFSNLSLFVINYTSALDKGYQDIKLPVSLLVVPPGLWHVCDHGHSVFCPNESRKRMLCSKVAAGQLIYGCEFHNQ